MHVQALDIGIDSEEFNSIRNVSIDQDCLAALTIPGQDYSYTIGFLERVSTLHSSSFPVPNIRGILLSVSTIILIGINMHQQPPSLPQLLPSLSQSLPNTSRQLVPDQTREHHNVFGSTLALRDDVLLRGSVELGSLEARVLVRQSDDGPDHDVADGARDDGLHAVESLCFGADGGHVACGVGGEDLGAFDAL